MFLLASVAYVAGLYLSEPVPYSGPVAVTALAGLIWSRPLPRGAARWTKVVLLGGLALLAAVLALDDRSGPFAEALTAAACAGIGLGVLGRAGRLRRWANVPAAVFAVLVVAVTAGLVADRDLWDAPPDIPARASAAFFPALTVIIMGLAANAALSSRGVRWAGLGLLPLLVLAFSVVPAVLAEDRFAPPARELPSVDVSAYINHEAVRAYMEQQLISGDAYVYSLPAVEPTPPPLPVAVASSALVDGVQVDETDPGPASRAAFLLLGLAAMATSLFPYRR